MTDQVDVQVLATSRQRRSSEPVESCPTGDPGTITDKGDRDLSPEMDLASEHAVRELLHDRTPDIPLLGEEEGGPDPSTGLCWVLDPIDGTVNYLPELPTYAIALSLIHAGQTVLAATHMPATETTYTATSGGGAYVDGKPLACRQDQQPHRRPGGHGPIHLRR